MITRVPYLDKLIKLQDKHVIKVVTGVRRCGKSTLLAQFQEYLLAHGVNQEQIIALNFERIENEPLLEYHALYKYVMEKVSDKQKYYIFLDEIQAVEQFQKTVDSLFVQENLDIYITGSNAYLLSGELATLLSGRYIEISMLPLSFAEYWQLAGGDKRDAWRTYFSEGGFPYLHSFSGADEKLDYVSSIYHTVLIKDIVTRKKVVDIPLLESIIKYLLDNVGNIVSSKKIADTLNSNQRKTSSVTVENYIQYLQDAFILYKVGRYDIKGKQHLKSLEKFYVVDTAFRSLLLGTKQQDIGHVLENIVFIELLRRGYRIYIGKIGELEVDFIAQKGEAISYYQVAASILDVNTISREMKPFEAIKDNYPKYIITMDEVSVAQNGIQQVNILDFLLEKY